MRDTMSEEAMTSGPGSAGHDSRLCGGEKHQGEGTCRRPAGWGTSHPGIGRCKLHGGSTPSHVVAAKQEQARRVLGQVWDPAAAPVTDAVAAMQKLAGQLEHAADVLGQRLGGDTEPCEVCGRGDLALDSPAAIAWLRVLREDRQLLEAMERLGIAQRFVTVEAARVELIAVALGRVFEVLELSDEQRAVGGRVLLDELRARETPGGPPELGGAA